MKLKSPLLILFATLHLIIANGGFDGKYYDEDCDSEDNFWCGDVCTSYNFLCVCGNVTLSNYSPYFCCVDPEYKCDKYVPGGLYSGAKPSVCAQGQVVHKSKHCHG